jgi:hypothetical protein
MSQGFLVYGFVEKLNRTWVSLEMDVLVKQEV